jgi:hypothetical protein
MVGVQRSKIFEGGGKLRESSRPARGTERRKLDRDEREESR